MTPNNNYELFNFTDPIEAAFEAVIEASVSGLDVHLPRSTAPAADLEVRIRFADGAATGHVRQVEVGPEPVEPHAVYDLYAGGLVEIDIIRHRWDAETVDATDTTSRDLLGELAGRIRFALRRVDAAGLNAALASPKVSHIRPLGGSRGEDEELGLDTLTLRYELNYGIPATIWPSVVLSEEGFYIQGEDGSILEAE